MTGLEGPLAAWRIVFEVTRLDAGQISLTFIAAGVGHVVGGRRHDVYALAHHRLHGSWPKRREH